MSSNGAVASGITCTKMEPGRVLVWRSLGRIMKLTGKQIVAIRDDWHGTGGKLSLWELTKKYDMEINEVYAVLSASMTKQMLGARRRIGMNVHSYDPAYGTRDKEMAT
jgi:hypothetical protein